MADEDNTTGWKTELLAKKIASFQYDIRTRRIECSSFEAAQDLVATLTESGYFAEIYATPDFVGNLDTGKGEWLDMGTTQVSLYREVNNKFDANSYGFEKDFAHHLNLTDESNGFIEELLEQFRSDGKEFSVARPRYYDLINDSTDDKSLSVPDRIAIMEQIGNIPPLAELILAAREEKRDTGRKSRRNT